MIQWSDTKRIIDPGYFCAAAVATGKMELLKFHLIQLYSNDLVSF